MITIIINYYQGQKRNGEFFSGFVAKLPKTAAQKLGGQKNDKNISIYGNGGLISKIDSYFCEIIRHFRKLGQT